MADFISLTDYPVRVSATGAQSLEYAVDVGGYDVLTLGCYLLSFEGPTSITVTVETGLQKETADGWIGGASAIASFTLGTPGTLQLVEVSAGFLRYVRWNVTTLTGAGKATFSIDGLARRIQRSG